MHASYVTKILPWKIWESATPPLWLKNFHGFNSVSNSWTPKKVAALRSFKMNVCRTDRSGEKPAFGGYASKVCEQLELNWAVNAFKGIWIYVNMMNYNAIHISNTELKTCFNSKERMTNKGISADHPPQRSTAKCLAACEFNSCTIGSTQINFYPPQSKSQWIGELLQLSKIPFAAIISSEPFWLVLKRLFLATKGRVYFSFSI